MKSLLLIPIALSSLFFASCAQEMKTPMVEKPNCKTCVMGKAGSMKMKAKCAKCDKAASMKEKM
jgi:hypothetical protein